MWCVIDIEIPLIEWKFTQNRNKTTRNSTMWCLCSCVRSVRVVQLENNETTVDIPIIHFTSFLSLSLFLPQLFVSKKFARLWFILFAMCSRDASRSAENSIDLSTIQLQCHLANLKKRQLSATVCVAFSIPSPSLSLFALLLCAKLHFDINFIIATIPSVIISSIIMSRRTRFTFANPIDKMQTNGKVKWHSRQRWWWCWRRRWRPTMHLNWRVKWKNARIKANDDERESVYAKWRKRNKKKSNENRLNVRRVRWNETEPKCISVAMKK